MEGIDISNGEFDRGVTPALQLEIHIYLTLIAEKRETREKKEPNTRRDEP